MATGDARAAAVADLLGVRTADDPRARTAATLARP